MKESNLLTHTLWKTTEDAAPHFVRVGRLRCCKICGRVEQKLYEEPCPQSPARRALSKIWRSPKMVERSPFAKLYNNTEFGQVLVVFQENEQGYPEIRFYAQPEEYGLGVCSVAVSAEDDSDESWDNLEGKFKKIDQADAVQGVKPIFDMLEQGC